MQIKLDGNTQMNGNILVIGEKILVTCGSGSDAFLHAIEHSAILETVRTGASGIGRGERILRV